VELLVGELSSLVEEHFLCLGWNLRVSFTFLFSRQAGNDVKVQVVHADIRVVERAYRVDEVSQRSTSAFGSGQIDHGLNEIHWAANVSGARTDHVAVVFHPHKTTEDSSDEVRLKNWFEYMKVKKMLKNLKPFFSVKLPFCFGCYHFYNRALQKSHS
jgi:hypothetical protein